MELDNWLNVFADQRFQINKDQNVNVIHHLNYIHYDK